jgi:hypothetical protein
VVLCSGGCVADSSSHGSPFRDLKRLRLVGFCTQYCGKTKLNLIKFSRVICWNPSPLKADIEPKAALYCTLRMRGQ